MHRSVTVTNFLILLFPIIMRLRFSYNLRKIKCISGRVTWGRRRYSWGEFCCPFNILQFSPRIFPKIEARRRSQCKVVCTIRTNWEHYFQQNWLGKIRISAAIFPPLWRVSEDRAQFFFFPSKFFLRALQLHVGLWSLGGWMTTS